MAVLAVCAAAGLPVQAALVDRGGGMIYDTVLDITWLADANQAKTSGYDADGKMNWVDAVAWASGLVHGGFSDWRLPRLRPVGADWDRTASYDGSTDRGWNQDSPLSELGYMYYVNLGLTSERDTAGNVVSDWGVWGNGTLNGTDTLSFGQRDIGLVRNLQSFIYWTGNVDLASVGGNLVWTLHTSVGFQGSNLRRNEYHAWAVRDGDVLPVPVPATLGLVALGLAALGFKRRRC